MKALITSGGRGTRLRPLTHTQNKHLIPIANKPIIHYAIEYCAEAGIKEIGIVYNADSTAIPDALGDGAQFGVKLTFIPQEAPLGLAHVVKISQDFIGDDSFVFYLGDNMVVGGLKRFIDEFEKNQSNCHLTLARVKDPQRFGVPEIVGQRIVRIEEKPQKPKSDYAVAGIYIYDSSIFEAVNNIKPSARGELEISDAHQYLLDHGYKITYSEITGWWKDTGKPYDLLEANRLVLDNLQEKNEGQVDENSLVTGKVVLEKGAKIINSIVRGPAIIGKNTVIDNSYIGPFTSIYDNCLIQNSEVEFSILLERCKLIDVTIRVEHSLLGNEVEIVKTQGRPATNRFLIGDQSRIELL
ncbi:glucose-1-phosphate thymidylyltransferase [Calditrichota bacterium LG25]|uniref:Glucose-1-phosphate thymidyltransferase n=1 Tax=Caldithrix abyssi DSM 13497 TaxID=880073 RepID=H1XRM7_CALAY|nr:glucose-1-phosphate thymidylyltransferase [Caldithrix abyssi]APF20111.1 glucose-1-phosphate thymidylyltransferase [Caldithrix abyssi DSM 13497]EHO40180.1 glucose-1-phosphate thymidyltransferase [Caldithrix abyssi DSM 13497]